MTGVGTFSVHQTRRKKEYALQIQEEILVDMPINVHISNSLPTSKGGKGREEAMGV